MAQITLRGTTIETIGQLPKVGSAAPDFRLTKTDLSELTLKELSGKRILLNISPSLDTGICATSIRRFNQEAAELANTVVLYVSMDLPFAHARFCAAEGIRNVQALSDFRTGAFGRDYGVRITTGPMAGLLSRAIVVVDEKGKVVYTEQVPEIAREPSYEKALAAFR